jgi:DNA-binding CsgD family transcriptional regulator
MSTIFLSTIGSTIWKRSSINWNCNRRIADELCISEKTVRNHITNIFDKLGVSTRAQAIVLAKESGF